MSQSKEKKMFLRRRSKIQIIIICVSLFILVFIIYQILTSDFNTIYLRYNEKVPESGALEGDAALDFFADLPSVEERPISFEKLIHLDLKGAPPLVSYLKEFFPYIKKLGATGVLIEYEDMFPYKDELEDIKALNAYTPSEIGEILESAEIHNLSVIPLIQTFGHFEFVLKLDKFKDLREVYSSPQVLCPSHERVNFYIRKMIDQVLEAHPRANYIHIGCDEVHYLGKCDRCRAILTQNRWKSKCLFINHVKNVAQYITRTYPGVRPIMWADMIHRDDEMLVKNSNLSSFVDLMIWKYVPNVSDYITNPLLKVYAKLFNQIWIASAFKGATGVNQIVTNAMYHLDNHIAWMNILTEWKKYINFKGIAITGWQRYNHFSVLCELLPVAIPSLTLSLHYLDASRKETHQNILKSALQCDSSIPFSPEEIPAAGIAKCDFPGFVVFQLINRFYVLSTKMGDRFSSIASGWLSPYQIVHKFSTNSLVREIFNSWPVDEYRIEIISLEKELTRALLEIYDEYTVQEWIMTYLTPLRVRLEAYHNAKEALLSQEVWPRRPFLNTSNVLEKAAGEICNSQRISGCGLLLG